ncbi:MAG: endonuclease NucS [archaeon]
MKILNNPKAIEAKAVLDASLLNKQFILLVGNCTVDYKGRASSRMGEGERLLMVKEDSSLTIHKKDRHAPVNYQTAGCDIKAYLDNYATLVIESLKKKDNDHLKVKFSEIKFLGVFSLIDKNDITVMGREKDLAKLVIAQPELIEPGLKLEEREKHIIPGAIDIYCKDKNGNFVVVELKRRTAGLNDVMQLNRYVKEIQRQKGKNEKVRGVLCAPSISPNAKEMLDRNNFEFAKLDPNIDKINEGTLGLVKDQSQLSEF